VIRDAFLNVRLNASERQLATVVSERLERNGSDLVRYLLRKEARELGIAPTDERQTMAGKHNGSGVQKSPTHHP
jgi:hypothetical protein